jgi:CheY-like chemotaxis protein
LALALEQAGHRVTVFADGPSALSGLAGLKPNAVLLDIGLPGMDGYEVAEKMRKKANLRHALFIGLSGFKRRAHGRRSGDDFDRYFVKPVDLAKLLNHLETRARAGGAEAATARRAPKGRKPLRVLLVEDNADLAAATEGLLRREGLEVRTALSGQEALQAAADFRPELTLCDLHLPDAKGLELVRAMRSNPATRHTRAVILTALSEAEIRAFNRGAKEIGVNEFVSKPLTSDVLQGLLAKVSRSHRVSAK